jgi:hypothetical protein
VSRDEHLEWCKQRAREYLATGNWADAVVSMLSDLSKHPETAKSLDVAQVLMFGVDDLPSAREFIEGFN